MLVWNDKGFVLKAAKTPGKFYKFGEEVPEDELAPGMKDRFLLSGKLIEKKAKAPTTKKEAPKPALPTPAMPAKPLPLPKKTESKPKPKKKGRK